MTKISPSVLASDLSNLASEVAEIYSAGAEMVHLDVMDGVFVSNMSFISIKIHVFNFLFYSTFNTKIKN